MLELSLVLLIMVAVIAFVVPRFRDTGRAALEAQAHRFTLVFRLLRSEAVLNGATYRLNYDLDQQRYWVTPGDQSIDLAEFARQIGKLARGSQIESPVGLIDVILPTLGGKIAQGQIYTVFYPDGAVDPTVIHMGNGRDAYTLWVSPTGRLKMTTGYREVEYGNG